LVTHLQQRQAQVTAHRHELEQTAAVRGENTDLGDRLALEYGLSVAVAELTWLDRTLGQLPQIASSLDTVQDDIALPTI